MPLLQNFQNEYGPRKFQVLAINLWEPWGTIRSFQNDFPNLLILRDPGDVWAIYDQSGYIPLNYIIDQEQIVDYFIVGFDEIEMRQRIEDLLPEVTVVLTPESETVPQGGILSLNATLINWESTAQTISAETLVSLPGGGDRTLLGPVEITIQAGDTISVDLQHVVPYAAPLGSYDYTGRLEASPTMEFMDSSSFTFEVIAPDR